ncbi:exportin-5-like [Penaeus chinensis]|uniref:exportin-5-like n=1 Tax=Penaeus chinensis TaxID=139456 RepID=UPI001FB71C51|nr:exportin-5-like [Penaeus chinensis]
MDVSSQVAEMAGQLAQAVNTTMDPTVPHTVRLASYNLLEKVKEESEVAVGCGFHMAHPSKEPVVRHLGLQLLEHTIKYKWNDLSVQQKVFIKNLESNQRRRDLYQAMTANMESMFGFFLSLLEENYKLYEATMKAQNLQPAQQHCRVMQVVLMTLTVYVEWVSVQHIFADDGKLLKSLCFLLSEDNLKMEAAECLLQIVSRKGKLDERRPLILLFGKSPMSTIFAAADRAVMGTLSEHNYRFLKTLTQVLTALGSQLCALWGKEADVGEPPNFRVYLDAMLAFTGHPSLHIYNFTNGLWGQLFRHEHIPQSKTLQAVLPSWITIVSRMVMKHGYPSKNDSESCQYSRLDFDSDEDYSYFFYKVRSETLETIKAASLLAPETLYSFVEEWLKNQVKKAADLGQQEKQLCNLFSPFYLEWEALSQVLESVMSRVMQSESYKPTAESGLELLRLCLSYQTTDPLILSTLLSCISGLFVFIRLVPSVLPDVLNKIFSALTFSLPGQTKDSRSRAVKNVRRHGCSLMVKIARSYPDILLEAFDFINGVVDSLSHNPQELSQMEKVTLQESLMIINNHFHIFEKQSGFIAKVLGPVSEIWLNMKQPFSSPLDFMSFVGLDKAPVEPSENDVNGQNRAQIIFCVNLIMAVIKRSEFPTDTDVAERGGFILERSDSGAIFCRNPATPHVMPLLHQLFCLVRLFNALWHPEALACVSPGYSKAHNLPEAERNNILGLATINSSDPCIDSPKVQQPLERMQFFLSMMHDNCYHILGNAGVSLGLQFYQHPHLTDYLVHSSLANLHLIPDYRLRPIIRTFLKPFIQWCPPQCYQTVLLPILNHLCPFMLDRLSTRWGHLTSLIESGSYEEENTDTQEMLEDLLIRMLTREYVDLLKVVLIGGPRGGLQDNMEGAMEAEMDVPVSPACNSQETLSDLGQLVLGCDTICQAIVTTLLKVLWWQDSGACLKAVGVVGQVLRWLVGEGQHLSPDAVRQVLLAVLQGLHTHGQHDANQSALLSLGLATYEMFRPHFPNIREVLVGLPGVSAEDVQRFEEKILNSNAAAKNSKTEKIKKDHFKKLVIEIVGRNVGQAFKKEVHMNNLPPMFKNPRPKQPRVDDTDADIGLCSLFGPDLAESNGHQPMTSSF